MKKTNNGMKSEVRKLKEIYGKLTELGYSKTLIEENVTIRLGSMEKIADLVVYREGSAVKSYSDLYIIVDMSKTPKKRKLDNLMSLMAASPAKYGILYTGIESETLYLTKTKNYQFQELPGLPRSGETLEEFFAARKNDLPPISNKSLLEDILHLIRITLDTNNGIDLFGKIMISKIIDEKGIHSEDVRFFVTPEEETEIMETGHSRSFQTRIESMFRDVVSLYPVYKDFFNEIDPKILLKIIQKLQRYSLLKTPHEITIKAIGSFVNDLSTRIEADNFTIPKPVIDLTTGVLNPSKNELVIDLSCGSGAFLSAMVRKAFGDTDLHSKKAISYQMNQIFGLDTNLNSIKLGKIVQSLLDTFRINILHLDCLSVFSKLEEHSSYLKENTFDIVFGNFPMGRRISRISEYAHFELAYRWKYDNSQKEWIKTPSLQSNPPIEMLFIERGLQFLKKGGRLAMIIPDSLLSTFSARHAREWIFYHSKILAVISLPPQTFSLSGIEINASLIILQKKSDTEKRNEKYKNYDIFMAISEAIGYDKRGNPVFLRNKKGKKIKDENGNFLLDTDIHAIVNKYHEFRKKNPSSE